MNPHSPTSCNPDQATPIRRRMAGRKGRFVLAALLGCLALLVLAPLADAASGSIKGAVTNTSAEAEEGIGVYAYNASTHELMGSAITEAKGEYEIPGLAAGSYKVEFYPPFGSKYAPQYYDDEHTFATATEVIVKEHEAKEAIDAKIHEGGKISGKVEADGKGVEGVDVYVIAKFAEGEGAFFGYGESNVNGEYTVQGVEQGLPEGEYTVEFYPNGIDLVPQFYEHGESYFEATAVKVEEEKTKKLNTVILQVGGEISGTVTDAVTHKPLAHVYVEALNTRGALYEFFGGYAETNEKGEYTIIGLGSGTYNLEFYPEEEALLQNYIAPPVVNGVKVTQPDTTGGINLELVPKLPHNNVAPVASGTLAVGQTLSCSTGSWTGEGPLTPLTYTYQWLRGATPISGATGSTYTIQSADQGQSLSCQVTATNKYLSANATSNTLSVPTAPPPPPPTPQVTISTSKIVLSSHGSGHVSIDCKGAPCSGTIEVTEQVITKHRNHRGRLISHKETVVLGTGSYALAAGQDGTFAIHVTKRGKILLSHARHHRLTVALVVSVSSGKPAKEVVVLSASKGKG
jgi:hypothetical protein